MVRPRPAGRALALLWGSLTCSIRHSWVLLPQPKQQIARALQRGCDIRLLYLRLPDGHRVSVIGLQGIVKRLAAVGLEAEVAEAYLRLLMQGPARPSDFARVQDFSRSGAYRHLERLEGMGLAKASPDRPVVYVAAEPGMLFELLERMNEEHAEAVARTKKELELSTLEPLEVGYNDRTFRHLVGRTACNEEIHRLLDRADHEVLMVDTNPNMACAQPVDLWLRLQRQAEAGLHQQIVVVQGSSLPSEAAHVAVRTLASGDVMKFLIVDRQSTFLLITDEEHPSGHGPHEQCLATSAPGLVDAQLELFERLWADSVPLSEALPAPAGYKSQPTGWQRR